MREWARQKEGTTPPHETERMVERDCQCLFMSDMKNEPR